MSNTRNLADFVAAGNPLADGTINAADISDVTATAAELNILDGLTATTEELNNVTGINSSVQTQLDSKLTATNNLSDVTNVTTARSNLGLTIGTDVQAYDANLTSFVGAVDLPVADGAAGQVLTTDGAGNVAFADAAGGGTYEFTASGGNITAGDIVSLNSDGTITGITVAGGDTSISATLGDLALPNTNYNWPFALEYDSVNNLLAFVYTVNDVPYVRFGTLSGSVVTWDSNHTALAPNNQSPVVIDVTYNPDDNSFVAAWLTSPGYIRVTAFSYSGGTVTLGDTSIEPGGNSYIGGYTGYESFKLHYETDRNLYILTYFHPTDNRVAGAFFTVSSRVVTTYNFAEGLFNPNSASAFGSVAYPSAGVIISGAHVPYNGVTQLVAARSYSGFYGPQILGATTITASGFTAGTPSMIHIAYNSTDDEFLYLYSISGSGSTKAFTFTYEVSTNAYTFNNVVTLFNAEASSLDRTNLVYNPSSNSYVFTVDGGGSYPDRTNAYVIEASGNTITSSAITDSISLFASQEQHAVIYVDDLGFPVYKLTDGTANFYTVTTTRVPDWLGIAKENITSGSAGKVYILGGVADTLSGLTTNTKYYLDLATSALTTNVTQYPVGKALTTTKLLITESS